MATLITKNSSTASAVPAVGDLVKGELAVNVTDKKVYTKDNSAAVVKLVGSLGNQEANAVAVTGGTINGTTIGATTTSTGAFTTVSASSGFTGNLTGNVTGNVSGTAANVTGVVAIANGGTGLSALGTGVQSALGQNVTGSGGIVLATSPSLTTPNLGTPSAAVLTNATGLPLTTGVTGTLGVANGGTGITAFGTGVATALGQNVTGSGGIVLATSPSLTTPNLGTPSAATLTNATGLPISTGVSGLGTGVATALAVNTGSAGAFVVNGGALGTPSSGTLTNATGLPLSTGVTGTLATTNGGTGLTSFTANGVVYASSTSALTTGSALTFDGTNFYNGLTSAVSGWTGIGRSVWNKQSNTNSIGFVSIASASDAGIFMGHTGSIGVLGVTYGASAGYTPLTFWTNDTEQMRLTSTGLGIGTSSPGAKLDVRLAALNGGDVINIGNSNGSVYGGLGIVAASPYSVELFGTVLTFRTGGNTTGSSTERMRLDSSGNLGIGVTPSGYLANKFVINTGTDSNNGITIASATNRNGSIWFADGTTGDQAYRGGVDYQHTNDTLYLYSGGQGNFQLTAAGNLGLGVTPSAWQSATIRPIEINRIGNFVGGNGSAAAVYLGANTRFESASWRYANNGAAGLYTVEDNTHFWRIAASGNAGDPISFTQAMTLDASGNLIVGGTTTPSGKANNFINEGGSGGFWTKSGGVGYFGTFDNYAMVLATNDTERARIDSDGNFIVQPNSGNARIYCQDVYTVTGGAAANMIVGSDGGFYRSTSSLKYKQNVSDAVHGLANLLQLRSVTYESKNPNEQGIVYGGLIAEEVHEAGLTEFVQYADDGTPDALAYGNMVSLCIKAIQEQQAIITDLRARVAQLEAK